MEVGEGEECQQGAFLFPPPPHALEFSLTLPLLTPATHATENIKFNKNIWPIQYHPFLPFSFTAFTLFNSCKLLLYILGEGHKLTSS